MTTAWVLLTALPPTTGHLALVDFARHVADEAAVLLCTQPDEPHVGMRAGALATALSGRPNVRLHHFHRTMPQQPAEAGDFWEQWRDILVSFGLVAGDIIVASEPYGAALAEITGTQFVPFDLGRDVVRSRATSVRNDPLGCFEMVIPEFQSVLRRTITVFGAESTGKTTLSRDLAGRLGAHWLPEWARPYLESLDNPTVDDSRMHTIWLGQRALQSLGGELRGRPFVIQDTDLFSTLGYWRHWTPDGAPDGLGHDARRLGSDLYIVTRSTIPFEPDPLRYGGSKRETPDEYWIDLLESEGLPHVVLDADSPEDRLNEATQLAIDLFRERAGLDYVRR